MVRRTQRRPVGREWKIEIVPILLVAQLIGIADVARGIVAGRGVAGVRVASFIFDVVRPGCAPGASHGRRQLRDGMRREGAARQEPSSNWEAMSRSAKLRRRAASSRAAESDRRAMSN